jgi:hypothetical protein
MPEKFSAQVFTPRFLSSCLVALTLGIHFGFGSGKNSPTLFKKKKVMRSLWSAHFVRISKAIRLSSGQSFLNFACLENFPRVLWTLICKNFAALLEFKNSCYTANHFVSILLQNLVIFGHQKITNFSSKFCPDFRPLLKIRRNSCKHST